jgi:hypothetical protein
MRQITLIFFLLMVASGAFAQRYTQAIGLRLGDPVGLNYRMFGRSGAGLEFGIGSANYAYRSGYYRDAFDNRSRFNNATYDFHRVNSSILLQGRYFQQSKLNANIDGRLDWFWGIGAAFRSTKVDYTYRLDGIQHRETVTDIDLGPEGLIGLEYMFPRSPISVFAEVSLMLEIADAPGNLFMLGGVGVRYNF